MPREPQPASPAQAVDTCHALLLWLIPQLDKLPRSRRHTLGSRLEDCLLEVLESLIAAAYQRDREALLDAANRRLAVAQHLWRRGWSLRGWPAFGTTCRIGCRDSGRRKRAGAKAPANRAHGTALWGGPATNISSRFE